MYLLYDNVTGNLSLDSKIIFIGRRVSYAKLSLETTERVELTEEKVCWREKEEGRKRVNECMRKREGWREGEKE